ncbi:MAG: TetR/AcrR family transcriptional regulator [Actinomycetes bacterium]
MPSTAEPRSRGARMPRVERRAQLLRAAREVFVAQGYHAAPMDDIAERAGVSKPVLYQHFPSKLELYVALLDESGDALVAAVQAALASTSDNDQRVAATIAAYFRFVDTEDGAFRLVFESDLVNEPEVRRRVDRVNELCAQAISQVISEDSGLDLEESMLVAVGLTGLAQVSARYWLTSVGQIPEQTATDLISTLLWRGIRGLPRRQASSPGVD